MDQGKNGLVLYELLDIISEGQTASSFVAVESSSGAIAAQTSFDFQQLKGFHFQVEAVAMNLFVVDRTANAPVILLLLLRNGPVLVEIVLCSTSTGPLVTKVIAGCADSGSYHISQAPDCSLLQISANMEKLH